MTKKFIMKYNNLKHGFTHNILVFYENYAYFTPKYNNDAED